MDTTAFSRRKILLAAGELFGAAWVGLDWLQLARAAADPHAVAQSSPDAKFVFFTPADAADVEAITAQIIPTDDTPGAREAGVVFFIDRALATFFSRLASPLGVQLLAFQHSCTAAHGGKSFAELPADVQIRTLTEIEHTPFFDNMRMLTVFGMFSLPSYGGNHEQLGWQLLGFDDQHLFEPPFGYYDRDYPGFVPDTTRQP